MVSFDVKSLFTFVLPEYTTDINIKQIFEDHEITTIFKKYEMRKLLTLCTKNVHLSFSNHTYTQIDRAVMDSSVIENIFVVELETTLVGSLCQKVEIFSRWDVCICQKWFRSVCSVNS